MLCVRAVCNSQKRGPNSDDSHGLRSDFGDVARRMLSNVEAPMQALAHPCPKTGLALEQPLVRSFQFSGRLTSWLNLQWRRSWWGGWPLYHISCMTMVLGETIQRRTEVIELSVLTNSDVYSPSRYLIVCHHIQKIIDPLRDWFEAVDVL